MPSPEEILAEFASLCPMGRADRVVSAMMAASLVLADELPEDAETDAILAGMVELTGRACKVLSGT